MLRGFGNILFKELKELVRDPKILVGMILIPLVMFPILGAIMSFSVQSAQEKVQKASILILNNDSWSNYSVLFIDFLSSYVKVFVVNETSPEQAVSGNLLSTYSASSFIEIPSGFDANMTGHLLNPSVNASVSVYSVFSGVGAFESLGSTVIDAMVNQFNRLLAPDPVVIKKSTIIKSQIYSGVDPSVLSGLFISQAIAMPVTIMILLTYSMQIAATSVAMEKEEKTLETLLTLPVDRFSILMGKLSGSIIIAGVAALAYMIGFNFYLGSFSGVIAPNTGLNLASLGLVPSLLGYLLLGISLFVTLLSALALAVILSAFAEDVRSAQSLVGYLYPLLFIPSLLLIYVDISVLPLWLKVVLYAIPYSHPVIASKAVTLGDYLTPIVGIVYVTAFTLVIMYVASRLFATERILTAKLRFRGFRRGRKTPAE